MRSIFAAITLIAAGSLGGCMAPEGTAGSASRMAAPGAVATLADATGATKGTVEIRAVSEGLHVHIRANDMQPGTYGLHIHGVGKCEGPGFTTAGGHWNPTMRQHGFDNPAGSHSGDIPNLVIGAGGTGEIDTVIRGATLGGEGGLLDADGASVMIHAGPDDYKTDPAGNSGGRIICGVLAAGA